MSDKMGPKEFVEAMKSMIILEVDAHITDVLNEMGKEIEELDEQEIDALIDEAALKRDQLMLIVLETVREYHDSLEETVH